MQGCEWLLFKGRILKPETSEVARHDKENCPCERERETVVSCTGRKISQATLFVKGVRTVVSAFSLPNTTLESLPFSPKSRIFLVMSYDF